MKGGVIRTVLVLAAVLAAVVGIVSALVTVQQRGAMQARLERKVADLAELERMQAALDHNQAVLDALNNIGKRYPESLADTLKSALTNATANVRDLGTQPAAAGWIARRVAVDFSDVPMDALLPVLADLEKSRPPWRLVEYSLRATRPEGRYGEAKLVLEHLEHTQ